MKRINPLILVLCLLWGVFGFLPAAAAFDTKDMPGHRTGGNVAGLNASETPEVLRGVTVEERLGSPLDLSLTFTNSQGQTRTLGEIIGDKPLVVTLNYYNCKTLCSLQFVNVAQAVRDMDFRLGEDYRIATISFDATDTPVLAAQKEAEYHALAHQPQGDWHFYVGDHPNIQALTQALGFFFKRDDATGEFAHTAALFVISPQGVISRYLYGITYNPRDLKFALMEASQNKIGSTTDFILLNCFHYNPTTGKYDAFAKTSLKLGAAGFILVLVFVLGYFFWFERKRKRRGGKGV